MVLVLVFVVPGVVFFSLSRRSGLPLRLLPLKPPPGLQKPVPGPPGPPGGLVISPPGTIISHLKVGARKKRAENVVDKQGTAGSKQGGAGKQDPHAKSSTVSCPVCGMEMPLQGIEDQSGPKGKKSRKQKLKKVVGIRTLSVWTLSV